VVASAEDVDRVFGKNARVEEPLGGGGVIQAVALDAVTRVDEEQVNALVVGLFA
jgi:hypothetical protein